MNLPVSPTPPVDLSPLVDAPQFDEAEFVALAALWCDQGMAHLIEIYEKDSDGTTPAGLVMIDFGTETLRKNSQLRMALAAPAVTYVVNRLQDQVNGGRTPKLDYVVISHQDTDHWSLLKYLLDAIEEKDWADDFKVGKICRGGSDWGKTAKKVLGRLATYVEDRARDYVPWTKNETSYRDPDADPGQVFNLGDVYFRLLTVNAPISSKKDDLKKNGTSAVLVLEFRGKKIVLPGDATYETLSDANKYLKKWAQKEKTPMQPCFVLSVPHHGSLRTIVPNYTASTLDFSIVREFTNYVRPYSTIASAGIQNSFSHPYLEVLIEFSKYVNLDFDLLHQIVFYSNETKKWDSFVLGGMVFTTQLTLISPIKVADWRFALNNDGQYFVTPYEFDGIIRENFQKPKKKSRKRKRTSDSRDFVVRPAWSPTENASSRGTQASIEPPDGPVRRVTARPGAGAP
jgi:beta-lactamase superfamily II metal-dependent hydrolase